MRKRMRISVIILTMLLAMAAPLHAQIFIMDDEFEGKLRQNIPEENLWVPITAMDDDLAFTPIGEGGLLLTALGGVYLLKKRKKKTNKSIIWK